MHEPFLIELADDTPQAVAAGLAGLVALLGDPAALAAQLDDEGALAVRVIGADGQLLKLPGRRRASNASSEQTLYRRAAGDSAGRARLAELVDAVAQRNAEQADAVLRDGGGAYFGQAPLEMLIPAGAAALALCERWLLALDPLADGDEGDLLHTAVASHGWCPATYRLVLARPLIRPGPNAISDLWDCCHSLGLETALAPAAARAALVAAGAELIAAYAGSAPTAAVGRVLAHPAAGCHPRLRLALGELLAQPRAKRSLSGSSGR
ncbi:MAG: hypothetical protein ACOCYV_00165 [Planctomycetota bacterium]